MPKKNHKNTKGTTPPKNVSRNLMDDFDEAEQADRDAALAASLVPYITRTIELLLAYAMLNYLTGKEVKPELMPILHFFTRRAFGQHDTSEFTNTAHNENHDAEDESEYEEYDSQETEVSAHDAMLSSLLSIKRSIMSGSTSSSSTLPDSYVNDGDIPEASFSFQTGDGRTFIGNSQSYTEVDPANLHTPDQPSLQIVPGAPRRLRREEDDGNDTEFNEAWTLETPEGSPERELPTPSAPVRARRPDAEESDLDVLEQQDDEEGPEASPIFAAAATEDGEQGFFSGERLALEEDEEEGEDENSDDDDTNSLSSDHESSDADDQDNINKKLFEDDSDDDLPGSNHTEGGDQL